MMAAQTSGVAQAAADGTGWDATMVLYLSGGLMLFATIALCLATALLWRTRAEPGQVLSVFGIIVILTLSVMVLVAGYSSTQLTPVIGLFGAVAGYLVGHQKRDNERRDRDPE